MCSLTLNLMMSCISLVLLQSVNQSTDGALGSLFSIQFKLWDSVNGNFTHQELKLQTFISHQEDTDHCLTWRVNSNYNLCELWLQLSHVLPSTTRGLRFTIWRLHMLHIRPVLLLLSDSVIWSLKCTPSSVWYIHLKSKHAGAAAPCFLTLCGHQKHVNTIGTTFFIVCCPLRIWAELQIPSSFFYCIDKIIDYLLTSEL